MWALGCILYELLALRHAFDGRDMDQLVQRILKGAYAPLPEARLCSPHHRPMDALSFAIAHACASIHPSVASRSGRARGLSAPRAIRPVVGRRHGRQSRGWHDAHEWHTAAREMTALRRCIAWRCGSS